MYKGKHDYKEESLGIGFITIWGILLMSAIMLLPDLLIG